MIDRLVQSLLLRKFKAPRLAHRRTPADFGMQAEEVAIAAADGGTLFGWWIPAKASVTAKIQPVAVVLHGWGANASMMLDMSPWIYSMGFHGLYVDARCHGRSTEADFSSMPRFAEDLESARFWVLKREDTDQEKLVAIGHSVGAAAVLLSASRTPWTRVVSLSAFAHPADVMQRYMTEQGIPRKLIQPYLMAQVQKLIGYRFDDIAPQNTIRSVLCPIMLVHGTEDTDVPLQEGRRLMANAPQARPLIIPGAGHDLRAAMSILAPEVNDFLVQATF